jgi:predicted dehydrogenase
VIDLNAQLEPNAIRVGVVGFGHWGPNYTRILSSLPGTSLAFVCDVAADRCRVAAQQHPEVLVTDNLEAALDALGHGAVVVATPAETHAAVTLSALQHGNHTLVEKPLGMDAREVATMVDTAEAAGLTLMVDHTYVFSDAFAAMCEAVERGELGGPFAYRSRRTNPRHVVGTVGVLRDLAVHDLSILDVLHDSPPATVTAHHPDVESLIHMVELQLAYADGSTAEVLVGWGTPERARHVELRSKRATMVCGDEETRSDREPLRRAVEHFLSSVVRGEPPITGAATARRVTHVLDAGRQSLASGGEHVLLDALEPQP